VNYSPICRRPSTSKNGGNIERVSYTVPNDLRKSMQELPQGCSEKETSRKIVTKLTISSGRKRTCTSIVVGQNEPCRAQCDSFGASPMVPGLVTANFYLFPLPKRFLKGQRFTSANHVTAKATRRLTDV
jgi:hypothetical protein